MAIIRWKQQARQMTFLRACGLSHPWDGGAIKPPVANIIGYGGAAGGGKSDALLVASIVACWSVKGCKVGYFRRKFVQLDGTGGAIMRSHELLTGIAKWNGSQRRWTFPNGSIIKFAHLENEDTVFDYNSQQFDVIAFDEATQFTRSQYRYMTSRNRATVTGITPFMMMATNPGNIGHAWFKAEFVEAGDSEVVHQVEVEEGQFEDHIFIPAKLSDNQVLEDRDPGYRQRLENQPEVTRRQLLDGDWDVAEGVAFFEWRKNIHTCAPFKIPDEWIKFRSADWGHAKPYSVGWYAIDFDGRMYKYRELYGWGGKPDAGTREDPEDVANRIIKLEDIEKIRFAVADDAIFGGRQDNSKSIAEQVNEVLWAAKHTSFQPVGKGPGSRKSGKLEVHHRLKIQEDGQPMLVIFNTCTHTIRTIPNLIVDSHDPEDVDTDMEDHAYDETRYACMARPMAPVKKEEPKTPQQLHKERLAKHKQAATRRVL